MSFWVKPPCPLPRFAGVSAGLYAPNRWFLCRCGEWHQGSPHMTRKPRGGWRWEVSLRCPGCGQTPCPGDERGMCPDAPGGVSLESMDDVEADEWLGGPI